MHFPRYSHSTELLSKESRCLYVHAQQDFWLPEGFNELNS